MQSTVINCFVHVVLWVISRFSLFSVLGNLTVPYLGVDIFGFILFEFHLAF